jgi:hypothetical protein
MVCVFLSPLRLDGYCAEPTLQKIARLRSRVYGTRHLRGNGRRHRDYRRRGWFLPSVGKHVANSTSTIELSGTPNPEARAIIPMVRASTWRNISNVIQLPGPVRRSQLPYSRDRVRSPRTDCSTLDRTDRVRTKTRKE